MPIWVIYLQRRRGLSLTQATFIDSFFLITLAASEIPTGIVADTFGHKASIVSGIGLYACALVLYGFGSTVQLLVVVSIARAIAVSFISGAESAFVYDVLFTFQRTSEYVKVIGRAKAVKQGSIALASVAGGMLASFDLTLPFFATAIMNIIALFLIASVKVAPHSLPNSSGNRKALYATTRRSIRSLIDQPVISYVLLYSAVLSIPTYLVTAIFLQPQALALGLPIASIGILSMLFRLANTLGFASSHRMIENLGERTWFFVAPIFILGGLVLLAWIPSLLGILLFTIACFVNAATRPLIENVLQRESLQHTRSTILSIDSLLSRLMISGSVVGLGIVSDAYGLSVAYLMIAIMISFVLFLLFSVQLIINY